MKKTSKLTAMHVHVIGIVSVVLVLVIVFFALIRPKNQDIETAKAATATAEQGGGTQQDLSKAQADFKKSQADTVKIKADWLVYSKKYMPSIKWDKDPIRAYYFSNQVNDMPAKWGNWVTNWYDVQRKQGVERDQGVVFAVPSLAGDPNGIAQLTSLTFPSPKDTWKVTVKCKSFDEAMAHLRRFNGMEHYGMPVVNNVTLSGQSPELLLSYDLALYCILEENPPAADARIGGASGTGGGGGMGGMMGPMSGGPMSGGPMSTGMTAPGGGMMGKSGGK